jgi:triphosphoribosyl-dephospho-CoA synthase
MTMAAEAAFLRACRLDVQVRKPGNVSLASPGHGMDAAMFLASAEAASGPLFTAGASVGERIEGAVEATWAVAGCNTNLGILLLCAPIAAAREHLGAAPGAEALRDEIEAVLAALDLDDASHAFRAIARANPGGLGRVEEQDVHAPPSSNLRQAMSLAAPRDRIARQYRDAFAELFELGLQALGNGAVDDSAVQRVYLAFLATVPDSHIVRKRGDSVAQHVMAQAEPWWRRARAGEALGADPAFAEWDEALKSEAINPGTSADLMVATLFLAGLLDAPSNAPESSAGGND